MGSNNSMTGKCVVNKDLRVIEKLHHVDPRDDKIY